MRMKLLMVVKLLKYAEREMVEHIHYADADDDDSNRTMWLANL